MFAPAEWREAGAAMASGRLAPYLGPGCLDAFGVPSPVPVSSRDLAAKLNARIAVPGRLRGNLWSAAQWIESNKHRVTLVRALQALFEPPVMPTPLHRWLAGIGAPLIVDEWYDTAMADALAAAGAAFAQIQGVRRSGQSREEAWTRLYDAAGAEIADEHAASVPTLLYKPHGAVRPAANFLVSDSDYVEVLTEINIQTPIPAEVIARRGGVGFVFLGCRFVDQMQRIFAREIIKRSAGPHFAVIDGEPSRNEARFLDQEGIILIASPLAAAFETLAAAAPAGRH